MISTRSHYVAIFHRNRKHLVCVCIKKSWHSSSIQVFLVQFNSTTSGSLFFFFLVQATDFRFVFFSVQQAWTSSNKFWFVEHFSEKKLVLSKCNPYVLEIWFVISDLRFAILFQLWYLRKSYSTDNNEQLKMYVQLWEIFGSIFHLRFYNMIIYFIPRIAKAWALPIQTRNCNKLNNGE